MSPVALASNLSGSARHLPTGELVSKTQKDCCILIVSLFGTDNKTDILPRLIVDETCAY